MLLYITHVETQLLPALITARNVLYTMPSRIGLGNTALMEMFHLVFTK